MKTIATFDSVTILSAQNGRATALNNVDGKEFEIRYSDKKNFIENLVGHTGEITGTSYDGFIQLSRFFE